MSLKDSIQHYQPFNEQEKKEKDVMLHYMNTFDNLFLRDNEFAHWTASSWIVNKDRTKVLMIYHNIYQSWAWTGGHADGDTNLLYVALKEAKEETGLTNVHPVSEDIYSLEILSVDGHIKRGSFIATHLHLNVTYLLEANEEDSIRMKPDENSGIQWVPIEDTITLCSEPYMKTIYEKLNKKLSTL